MADEQRQQLAIVGPKLSTLWAFNGMRTIVLEDSRHSDRFAVGMQICFVDGSGRRRAELEPVVVCAIDASGGYVTVRGKVSLTWLVPGIAMEDAIYSLGTPQKHRGRGRMKHPQAGCDRLKAWIREQFTMDPKVNIKRLHRSLPDDLLKVSYGYFRTLLREAVPERQPRWRWKRE